MAGNSGPTPITYRAAPVAAILLLLALLGVHEGEASKPYRDPAGIWTVCRGVTGPAVIPGRTYTAAECRALEQRHVNRMTARMSECLGVGLTVNEWVAWGDFAYNVGTEAFCTSTASKLLRAGDKRGACAQITRWRFVQIDGVKRDCALPQWRKQCGGIVTRREKVRALCETPG